MVKPAPAAEELVTVDAFLAHEGEPDTHYQLIDGVIVAMNPPVERHGTIVGNAAVEVDRRLEHRPPCRAVVNAGVRFDEHNYFEADIAATCEEPGSTHWVDEPLLIVEVLSPSTANRDQGDKFAHYSELPSLQELWLVDSRKRWVQVWRRHGDDWIVSLPIRGAGRFRSEALDDTIQLDRLYRNSGLDGAPRETA